MSFVSKFLKKNPQFLTNYVKVGFTIVDKTVTPLNKLMQHLLEVQGIDPRTQPGETSRKILAQAMSQVDDPEDFDVDFNFGPALKAFGTTSKKLAHLNLTKEQFKKATDLTFIDDKKTTDLYRSMTPTKDLPHLPGVKVVDESLNPMEDLFDFTKKYGVPEVGSLSVPTLKDALQTLKKFADKLADEERVPTEKVDIKRQPTVVGPPKRSNKKSKTIRTSTSKGVFRRVKDED